MCCKDPPDSGSTACDALQIRSNFRSSCRQRTAKSGGKGRQTSFLVPSQAQRRFLVEF